MKQQKPTNQSTVAENENVAAEAAQVKENREHLEEPESYEEAIEAILFAAGHPVSYETLAKTFELRAPILRNMVKEYAEKYNKSKLPRGVMLLAMDKECQLCTKPKYLAYIRSALGIRRNGTLSAANLETLAIVAYHQPVTRAYIDAVRGVDSSYAVASLVERGLIEAKGRLDAPGRPVLFGTSTGFLRCFGLNSVDELPGLDNEELQQVFRKVEEKLESEASDNDRDENQLTIDDAIKQSEEDSATESEPLPVEEVSDSDDTDVADAQLPDLPFDLSDDEESEGDAE